jgi:pseudouridine synthase
MFMPVERLQKIMARAGLGSRRKCEEIIQQGRVEVDGKIATLGLKVDPARADIEVDGRSLPRPEPFAYVALYKPRGVLSVSHDDRGRRTVRDLVPLPARLYPVGRLDAPSEGLILMTNDGALTNRLTHPRYEHEKVYKALVAGDPSEEELQTWQQGVYLDGRRTAPAQIRRLGAASQRRENTWLRITLHEGRKRQIRRVGAMLGYPVRRLIRERIGPIEIGDLKPGEWRHLSNQEVRALQKLKGKKRQAKRGRRRR